MKFSKIIISLACLSLMTACGGGSGGSDSVGACNALKITNGDVCESDRNPVVLLKTYDAKGNSYVCSGSIITRTSVLTAAHCLAGMVAIDVYHRNAAESASEGFIHGGYTGNVGPNDLAILKVSPQFTQAANFYPLPLNISEEVAQGTRLTIFGFGLDEHGELSVDYPKAAYVTFEQTIDSMIAVSSDSGIARNGDSGGPLVHNKALLGVLSGGNYDYGFNLYVNIRESSNLQFIAALASDAEVKSSKTSEDKAVENGIAIKWEAKNKE